LMRTKLKKSMYLMSRVPYLITTFTSSDISNAN
jgi:hypothetical protein